MITGINLLVAQDEFHAGLMHSTFKIQGDGALGTAFVVAKKIPNTNKGFLILVTAKHVLDGMSGDTATLFVRSKQGDYYLKDKLKIPIRSKGKNLYTSHPTEDIAVMNFMYSGLGIMIPYELAVLATDSTIKEIDLHPGDELFVLGYPYGIEANDAGFPILRSGKIASYPIYPTKIYKSFLMDFPVYKGNSGGPVYMNSAFRGNQALQNKHIVGLVSQEATFPEHTITMGEEKIISHKLSISIIIPSTFILEAINLMPTPVRSN